MQITDRDFSSETDWQSIDDPRLSAFDYGFRSGVGFVPSSADEEEALIGTIELDQQPEELEEKDRVGEDTRPRR